MQTIVVRLDPRQLKNPDTDLRYQLPALLTERSGGVITDDGYDYVGKTAMLVLFLETSDLDKAVACVLDVVQNVQVLGNDLKSAAVVAVEREGQHEVVYPPNFVGPFLPENRNAT